ncbi:outer membrane beta-barrel protein [uncultured Bacteroides sp.]|uniref:outer membrane beta-barrel protein n=1 Tax=uncultured Bacteroides sp. TaxID=162156 RepID=UPI0025F44C21|nr:outer membrane beta-barrel protein [uncultured Bacteroides sp.]
MKTLKQITLRAFAIAALTLVFVLPTKAQMTDNGYANIDWQYNFPLNNHFADKGSGWGMNFEGGYFLTSNFALGGFLAYHSNHEYFGRQTLPIGESGSLNTDQQHTVFQLPFGLATRYAWNRGGAFQPYIGVKLGAQYAQLKSTFNAFKADTDTWGFYVSPEVGFNVYPWAYGPGVHFAAYYSYGTNKGNIFTYSVDGMDNLGLRVGIAF